MIPIIPLIVGIGMYILTHALIGMWNKQAKKDWENANTPDNAQLYKWSTILFKWYPSIFLVGVIAWFYLR